MDNYFAFDGKYYAIDIDELMKAVSKKDVNENETENTVIQSYGIPVTDEDTVGDNIKLIRKDITETTSNVNETMSNYRYNLITSLLNLLVVPISDGTGSVMLTNTSSEMHFGQRLAFNTLFEMDIIYEINFEQ